MLAIRHGLAADYPAHDSPLPILILLISSHLMLHLIRHAARRAGLLRGRQVWPVLPLSCGYPLQIRRAEALWRVRCRPQRSESLPLTDSTTINELRLIVRCRQYPAAHHATLLAAAAIARGPSGARPQGANAPAARRPPLVLRRSTRQIICTALIGVSRVQVGP